MNIVKRTLSIIYNKLYIPVMSQTVDLWHKMSEVQNKYHITSKIPNVVILGTPNHGNLGDYAINVAERDLFHKAFPDWNIFEVDLTDFPKEVKALKKVLSSKDILVLTGGGNLGNQYMDDERVRRDTIRLFWKNRVYMFPQTCYFTEDEEGKQEKEKTEKIYNAHQKLLLMARDAYSYDIMKDMFRVPVRLMPDVVLTLFMPCKEKREGALLLLRNDVERKYTTEQEQELECILQRYYSVVDKTDTEIPCEDFLKDREGQLQRKIKQIGHAELVVTDRLHGMVFAAITETPCLVLDNYNHKVRETYQWLAHLPYVKYLNDISEFKENVEYLQSQKDCVYEHQKIEDVYQELMQEIRNG